MKTITSPAVIATAAKMAVRKALTIAVKSVDFGRTAFLTVTGAPISTTDGILVPVIGDVTVTADEIAQLGDGDALKALERISSASIHHFEGRHAKVTLLDLILKTENPGQCVQATGFVKLTGDAISAI